MRSLFLQRPHFRDLFYSLRAFINFDRSMKPNLQNSISNWSDVPLLCTFKSIYTTATVFDFANFYPHSGRLRLFIILYDLKWGENFQIRIQGTTLPIAHNKVRSKVNTKLVIEVYTTYLLLSSTYCKFTFYYFHRWTYLCWIFLMLKALYSFTSLKAGHRQD